MASGAVVDLTEGKVSSHVLRMLGPFSIAVIALISTGIVDTIYLGNLIDVSRPNLGRFALAALGVAFPITFVGNSVNIGLGAGQCPQFRVLWVKVIIKKLSVTELQQ